MLDVFNFVKHMGLYGRGAFLLIYCRCEKDFMRENKVNVLADLLDTSNTLDSVR